MKPNLFEFATSELSQDAFLCWLLAWADPQYASHDEAMHQVGRDFLYSVFERANERPPSRVQNVRVQKQMDKIDVVCRVNSDNADDKRLILIEDKVFSKQHSGQLERYRKSNVTKEYSFDQIIPVYLQTGEQSDYSEVEAAQYSILKRGDLLSILESPAGKRAAGNSDILADFTARLRSIEDEVQSFKTLPIEEWKGGWIWMGFYQYLQRELGRGNWDYVPNQSEGFYAFWWGASKGPECGQYLQLEEEDLCFKIDVAEPEKQRSLRMEWHQRFMADCPRNGIGVRKPKRFGTGATMTVAKLTESYRVVGEDGVIDLERTCDRLRSAEAAFHAARQTAGV